MIRSPRLTELEMEVECELALTVALTVPCGAAAAWCCVLVVGDKGAWRLLLSAVRWRRARRSQRMM
eukprot:COSAG02_NODE_4922_length_4835_cov_30.651605_3_plen_66_part_00